MNSQDIIKFAIDTLQSDSRFVDIDMSETSQFYNLVILPFSILAKPLYDLNATTLNSMQLQNMSSSQLDQFGDLFFIQRRTESLTNVIVQIYLTNQTGTIEPLVITTSDEFKTAQNAVFYPIQDYIFTYSTLPLDSTNTYRVATIICSSSLNSSIVPANSISSTTITHPNLSSVSNSLPSSSPLPAESDADFITSIQQSLTNRNAISTQAIYTILKNAFPDITDCLAIGYGDPEMQRDIAVAAQAWSGHFGGMSDIYTRTEITPISFTTTATRNATNNGYTFILRQYKGFDWNAIDTATPGAQTLMPWTLLDTTPLPTMPVITINWSSTSITNTTINLNANGQPNYLIEVMPDPVQLAFGKNYRYSIYESLRITIYTATTVNATETVTFAYNTLNNFANIQNYINSDSERIITSNNLIKSFIPIEIKEFQIVYDQNYYVNEQAWATQIAAMINGWSLQEPIRFSTLLKSFDAPIRTDELWLDPVGGSDLPYTFDAAGEVTGTKTSTSYPCFAKMSVNNIDGSSNLYLSTRQLYPKIKNGLSATYRTCRYFIDPANIIFVKGSW